MRKIVFDIETKNFFHDVGSSDPAKLDIALVAIHDSETDSYSSYLESELNKLWPILERADMLIGFTSEHFDMPLLNKYYPGDLTKIKHLDILKEIKQSYGRRMKLDQLAEGTLGKHKSGHGSDALKWWRAGEIERIRQYCIDDVRLTKELYDHARANNKLMFKEGGQLKEIKLDTAEWEKPSESKLTFSLPF
ncbi:MAG: ribonuclease H-like domain-containing protein [Candidatus Zambryskibacteria bacterium]|nr:ribonuclease H-like domain-containing protein [Candidatus Zambryskibacteria bacterium]